MADESTKPNHPEKKDLNFLKYIHQPLRYK